MQRRAVGAEGRGERSNRAAEHERRVRRIDRQLVLEVAHHQQAIGVRQDQLAAFEHAAVLIAEDREQELGLQRRLDRRPIDVEEARRGRARPVLEHVAPPRVGVGADAHVIRHEVHDVSEAERVQAVGEARVRVGAAELGIDRVVIADVVAVRAARHRREVRRGVDRADAEARQVARGLLGRRERKGGVQLQSIRADRNVHELEEKRVRRCPAARPGR